MSAQSKHQFYHKGVDIQKRADVTVDLRRPTAKQIKKWSVSERLLLLAFINNCRTVFDAFEKEISEAAK